MADAPETDASASPTEEPMESDEWTVGLVLTVGAPLLLCMTVFVVIVLAFSGWKLY